MDEWENFNKTLLNEKEDYIATQMWRILHIQITCMEKEFVKT